MVVQRNLRPVLLAVLCVLAVALGAATLQSPVAPGSGSGGVDPSMADDGDSSGLSGQNNTQGAGSAPKFDADAFCVPFLLTDTFALLATLVALLVAALLYRRGGALLVAAGFGAAFVPALVLYLLLTDCGPASPRDSLYLPSLPGSGTNESIFSGAAGAGGSTAGATPISPAAIVLLAVLAAIVAIALFRATGDDADERAPDEEPEPEPEPEEALAAVGAAAGAAAERIDAEADVENEVFRAWREMTDHLAVSNPDASTPAEFATAAREAGMDQTHVDALTDLFREVRYGGERPTPDREERALAALRAIEDAYAESEEER